MPINSTAMYVSDSVEFNATLRACQ